MEGEKVNEFIEFRNHVYDNEKNYIYPLQFLDNYINKSKTLNFRERVLIKHIQTIKKIEREKQLGEKEIDELCSFLGKHSYIDRFTVDTILKLFTTDIQPILENKMKNLISQQQYSGQKLYHVLDICIECELDIVSDDDLIFMLVEYKQDLDTLSILLDYIDSFKRQGFKDLLYNLLTVDYPETIEVQIVNMLANLYSMDTMDQTFVKNNIIHAENKVFYDSYTNFVDSGIQFKEPGISIMQSMFYGDFEDSGKGNNGGLAILLKGLGEEISKHSNISNVFTITITQELDKPFIRFYGDKHAFIRLPIYLDQSVSDKFIKRELFIKRYIGNFLKRLDINPDVFHIRFLDNASKAVAHLAKELDRKLVFTLTPDPHRNMFDGSGHLKQLDFKELIEKLNKIKIGDELIGISDGIVGIGNSVVKEELEIYFPQFKEQHINKKIRMIGEGIQIDKSIDAKTIEMYANPFVQLSEAQPGFFDKPIILNVGRLSVLKGQMELLKAWSNSKLSETHNLLLIGGDLEKPNAEEKAVIDFFAEYVQTHPEIKDTFMHKGAMSNLDVRLLEMNIIKTDFDYPHIYLCSSVKEEFGIAILEAMSNGFLTLGPIKGGVKTYMRNGENGFLIDTDNFETIARETEKYLYDSGISKNEFKEIQAAAQTTIDEHFSIEKVSHDFASFYVSLKGETANEI